MEYINMQQTQTSKSMVRRSIKLLFRNPFVAIGTVIIILIIFSIVVGPIFFRHDPIKSNLENRLLAPCWKHICGTDAFGRDVFVRILHGGRVSLSLALIVVIITIILASLIGIYAAWSRRFDNFIMRIMDVMMSIPSLILAIALMAFLGGSKINLIIAIVLTQLPRSARIVRSSAIAIKEREFIEAAQAIGCRNKRILFRHLLPNCLSPIMVNATFLFAHVILVESTLSFVGVGTPPPAPSWGNMLAEGREVMAMAPWLTIIPGCAIMLVVLGLNLLGDGLRDILDPRIRQ